MLCVCIWFFPTKKLAKEKTFNKQYRKEMEKEGSKAL